MRLIGRSSHQGGSHSRKLSLVTLSAVLIVALAVTSALLVAKSNASQQTQVINQMYNDNGLTCAVPQDVPAFVAQLIPAITQSQKFGNATSGAEFVFEHWDNITDRSVTIGSTTSQLPPATELVFYTYGPNTTCGMAGEKGATAVIYAQVPLENGAFKVPDESVYLSHYLGEPA